jgi:WD40 repeat protein
VKERAVLEGHDKPVLALTFAPQERPLTLASAGADGTVRLWDLSATKPVSRAVVKAHAGSVSALAFTASGKALASGGNDQAVQLWDVTVKEPKEKALLEGHAGVVTAVAFAPDGRTALSGDGDSRLQLWDLTGEAPKEAAVFGGTSGYVYSVAVAPDGKTVATYGPDGKLVVWELPSGKRLLEWAPPEYLGGVAFAPDSRHLAVGVGLGPVYVLRLAGPRNGEWLAPRSNTASNSMFRRRSRWRMGNRGNIGENG